MTTSFWSPASIAYYSSIFAAILVTHKYWICFMRYAAFHRQRHMYLPVTLGWVSMTKAAIRMLHLSRRSTDR